MAQKKITAGHVVYERVDGKQVLKIDILPELEKLFKTEDTQTSERCKDTDGDGLEFYELDDKLSSYTDRYNQTGEHRIVTIRDYGTNFLTKEGKFNMSILRTVGIEDGIEVVVDGMALDHEVKDWADELASFLKFLYANFVESVKINTRIEFEA